MSTDGFGGAALVALVAIVPLVVLMLTSFVKISVVLALLRNALGAPDAFSGLVVLGLSLVLTFFVMAPVGVDMLRAAGTTTTPAPSGAQPAPATPAPAGDLPAGTPVSPPTGNVPAGTPATPAPTGTPATPAPTGNVPAGTSVTPPTGNVAAKTPVTPPTGNVPAKTPVTPPTGNVPAGTAVTPPTAPLDLDAAIRQIVPAKYQPQVDAVSRAVVPLKGFLARHADARERETFVGLAARMGRNVSGDELWVLAPAFLATELREAFAIAVLLFLPFLVLDLVVGLGLAALGLTTTQPQTVALPLKLLLFVAVDGWRLLIDSLLRGYV